MREEERQRLRMQYDFRCGYCGVRETDVGAELTIDHFQPRSQDGSDASENLVYCCHACNEFKGDYWQPDTVRHILHPLRDDLSQHVAENEDGLLQALTETGAFHIQRLHLNRDVLVAHRREQRRMGAAHDEQQALLNRLAQLEQHIETLQTQIALLAPVSEADSPPE